MSYKDEIVKAMAMLAGDERTLFVGQSVRYSGHIMYETLEEAKVPMDKRIEMPVAEDMQMGISIGLALEGYIPISIYPRMDFLIIAMNQLVNHLDKIREMSCGQFTPKVIIRTMVGSKKPLDPGPQHRQDHTRALEILVPSMEVVKLRSEKEILGEYKWALRRKRSTILIEMGDLY